MQDNFKDQTHMVTQAEEAELPEMHNLTGFFELLLKVDKRVNPALYPANKTNQPTL